MFVLCQCDIAGIWEHDFEACEFFVGEKIEKAEIEKIFKSQLVTIDQKRYFVKDFIEFQNGKTLNVKSPVHKKIISILEKHRLLDRVFNRVSDTQLVLVEVIVGVEEEVIVVPPPIFLDKETEIRNSHKWLEKIAMTLKIPVEEVHTKLEYFISKEQLQPDYNEKTLNDFKKHFANWIAKYGKSNQQTGKPSNDRTERIVSLDNMEDLAERLLSGDQPPNG
jgi:hypothetical protein